MEKINYADFLKKETREKEDLKEKINKKTEKEEEKYLNFNLRYLVKRGKTVRESSFIIKGFQPWDGLSTFQMPIPAKVYAH